MLRDRSCFNFLLIALALSLVNSAFGQCGAANWIQYTPDKCVLPLPTQILGKPEAETLCRAQTGRPTVPTLLMIKSPAEQRFIQELLYEQMGLFESVWLDGSRYNSTGFIWADNSSLLYSNWDTGFPTNESNNSCFQMTSPVGIEVNAGGNWRDVPCAKRNMVVCQSPANLTLVQLQEALFTVINNPVPFGFIYTQYLNQESPQEIFPSLVWQDVTNEFQNAGVQLSYSNSSQKAFPLGELPEIIPKQNPIRIWKRVG